MLASFACDPTGSRGRLYEESTTPYRNEFQRDKDRIIHSNAFRRLEYKTQVYVNHEGDHYRNRLTHSIEVASIARSIATELNVSADLAEAIALAHDMGHTPFGHAGEDVLDACMKDYGGFDHNAQSVKLMTELEQRYAAYDGLNLTWEVLEGLAKHNGPLTKDIPDIIVEYNAKHDLDLGHYSSMEAQIASLSDDIAYHGHDLEDAIRAELIHIDDLRAIDFLEDYINAVLGRYPNLHPYRLIYETIRFLNHYFVDDLLAMTRQNIKIEHIVTEGDVRMLGKAIVEFSHEAQERLLLIKSFLFDRVYTHKKVTAMTTQSKGVVKSLFGVYMKNIKLLPEEWYILAQDKDERSRAIIVADYIAGMTDRYAIRECESLCNLKFSNSSF